MRSANRKGLGIRRRGFRGIEMLFEHLPVLLQECIEGLNIKSNGIYVDGTLGRGGHTLEIVKRLDTGRVIAIDSDAEAISEASILLTEYENHIRYIHGNFVDIGGILDTLSVDAVDGMLFDLGVSSPQVDNIERGFSYMHDAPLDMRMDRRGWLTAFEAVNSWPESELRRIFHEYGEERYAGLIARAIIKKRVSAPIRSTFELNEVIFSAMPAAARREVQHPAKRCYQALRIAVNGELESISGMLDAVPSRLKAGGRLCVISFHSLEDRLVKNSFAALAKSCVCPKDFPVCVCGKTPILKVITKKPITPGSDEVERNPRARSAKLRIAEKLVPYGLKKQIKNKKI